MGAVRLEPTALTLAGTIFIYYSIGAADVEELYTLPKNPLSEEPPSALNPMDNPTGLIFRRISPWNARGVREMNYIWVL